MVISATREKMLEVIGMLVPDFLPLLSTCEAQMLPPPVVYKATGLEG